MEKPISITILIIIILTAFSGAVTGGSPGLVTPGQQTTTSPGSPGQSYFVGDAPDLHIVDVYPVNVTTSLSVMNVTINNTAATIMPSQPGTTATIYDFDSGADIGSLKYIYTDTWEVSDIDIDLEDVPEDTNQIGTFTASYLGTDYEGTITYQKIIEITPNLWPEVHRGKNLTLAFDIGNAAWIDKVNPEGAGSNAGSSWVGFYLSPNIIITKNDIYIGRFSVPMLPGGWMTGTPYITNVTIPTNMKPGFYYIGAIADYNNLIPELYEINEYSTDPPSLQFNYYKTQVTVF